MELIIEEHKSDAQEVLRFDCPSGLLNFLISRIWNRIINIKIKLNFYYLFPIRDFFLKI